VGDPSGDDPDLARRDSCADGELASDTRAKIPLGQVSGRIDHLGIDVKRQRLLVAELGNNSLGVVDLAAGKVLSRISGLSEPQGVAYFPFSDSVFVANAGDGSGARI
jgi:YVTN family beta-propeller protein